MSLTYDYAAGIVFLVNCNQGGLLLALPKRPPVTKALASGVLAFTVGLTATAAYISTTIERMPYSFNAQQQASETSETAKAKPVTKQSEKKDDKTNETLSSTSPTLAPAVNEWPGSSQTATQSPLPEATSSLTQSPTVIAPVEETIQTIAPSPHAPNDSEDTLTSEPLLQPVTNVVDGLVRTIGP